MKYTPKIRGRHVRLVKSKQVFARWWHLVAFMRATHEPPPSGDVCGILVLPHRNGHQKGQQRGTFCIIVFLLCPWRPSGQYRANSCLMAASSGFRRSPGHAASGDTTCFASTPPHDYRNGLQRRNIRSLPRIFSLTLLVAKDHVMVH
jgi:hypothetical protein